MMDLEQNSPVKEKEDTNEDLSKDGRKTAGADSL